MHSLTKSRVPRCCLVCGASAGAAWHEEEGLRQRSAHQCMDRIRGGCYHALMCLPALPCPPGKWNGFGGKVELGESVAEAAVRELQVGVGITRMNGCSTFSVCVCVCVCVAAVCRRSRVRLWRWLTCRRRGCSTSHSMSRTRSCAW